MSRLRTLSTFFGGAALSAVLILTGTHAWQVGAAPGDTDATYQPLSPCRLFDTRSGPSNIGDRKAPIGPGETYTAQVTGTNGDCVDIPDGATGVAMNVTVVNPTAPSNLRVFPADLVDVPLVSNLNYANGSPPTPNKVDSKLSPDGKIKVFNAFGTADVIVDLVGVYIDTSLTEIENRLAALEAADNALFAADNNLAEQIRDAKPATASRTGSDVTVTTEWTRAVRQSVNITRAGVVIAFANATAFEDTAGYDVQCVITDDESSVDADRSMLWEASGATAGNTAGQGDGGNLAGTRAFDVQQGTAASFSLMCRNTVSGTSEIWDPHMTLLFIRD